MKAALVSFFALILAIASAQADLTLQPGQSTIIFDGRHSQTIYCMGPGVPETFIRCKCQYADLGVPHGMGGKFIAYVTGESSRAADTACQKYSSSLYAVMITACEYL